MTKKNEVLIVAMLFLIGVLSLFLMVVDVGELLSWVEILWNNLTYKT